MPYVARLHACTTSSTAWPYRSVCAMLPNPLMVQINGGLRAKASDQRPKRCAGGWVSGNGLFVENYEYYQLNWPVAPVETAWIAIK